MNCLNSMVVQFLKNQTNYTKMFQYLACKLEGSPNFPDIVIISNTFSHIIIITIAQHFNLKLSF